MNVEDGNVEGTVIVVMKLEGEIPEVVNRVLIMSEKEAGVHHLLALPAVALLREAKVAGLHQAPARGVMTLPVHVVPLGKGKAIRFSLIQ